MLLSCQKSHTALLVSTGVILLPALVGFLFASNAPNRLSHCRDRASPSTWSASEPVPEIKSVKFSASLLFCFLVFGVTGVQLVDSLNFFLVSTACVQKIHFFCFEF